MQLNTKPAIVKAKQIHCSRHCLSVTQRKQGKKKLEAQHPERKEFKLKQFLPYFSVATPFKVI